MKKRIEFFKINENQKLSVLQHTGSFFKPFYFEIEQLRNRDKDDILLMERGIKMERLYQKLMNYSKEGYYGFHMPGHKRSINPFEIDITEIDGFDDLHDASGIIKESEQRAAALYRSEITKYIVNGSTAGILSAISACVKRGGKILIARNCHRSVYHGILLRDLEAVYLYPEKLAGEDIAGAVLPEEVAVQLAEEPQIEAVLITSPTYEGICSDVEKIADICHNKGIPLIVDQAHGAHFGLSDYFPANAVGQGADVVIHSLHKTLPSLTQTALIHINGTIADKALMQKFLSIYQTTSPSYVLMASIDYCIQLLEKDSEKQFQEYYVRMNRLRESIASLAKIKLLDGSDCEMDISKIILSTADTNISGIQLYEWLQKDYRIEMEMISGDYVLGMTSIADTEAGFERMAAALSAIDAVLEPQNCVHTVPSTIHIRNKAAMKITQASEMKKEFLPIKTCQGHIAADFIYLYPPGIPLIAPGEVFSKEIVDISEYYFLQRWNMKGIDETGKAAVIE